MSAAAGVAGALALYALRGFPWTLAVIAGLGIALFAWSLVRGIGELRRIWRRN